MINILIADDHTIVREGIKQILSENAEIKQIDEANNGQQVLTKIAKKNYDVVLLDIAMPGRNGIEILKDIKNLKPDLPVLMLSMYPEETVCGSGIESRCCRLYDEEKCFQ